MNRRLLCFLPLFVFCNFIFAASDNPANTSYVRSFAEDQKTSILVNPSWLSEHINDSNLIIMHISRLRQEYTKGHIPGALFYGLDIYLRIIRMRQSDCPILPE